MLPLHHRRWAVEYRPAINRFGVLTGLGKRVHAATVMLTRQRLGMVVIILFPDQTEIRSESVEGLGPIYVDIHHQIGDLVLVPPV